MGAHLIDEIVVALQEIALGRVLSPKEATARVDAVAGKYGLDLNSLCPWEKVEGIAYPYNDASEWGLLLSSMLGVFPSNIYLVVTDERTYPWPVVVMAAADVPQLLLELPHFEFFIFDEAGERVVVDTQHNELIMLEKS